MTCVPLCVDGPRLPRRRRASRITAVATPVDYLAVGPVFTTTTKQTERLPIGIQGVKRLREQAGPGIVLTAAAGITLDTAQAVLDAGANTVAVSAALFRAADPAAEFKRWLQHLG